MPIAPIFRSIPKDVVEWGRFFRDATLSTSDGTVTDDSFAPRTGLSVIGVSGATASKPSDINASADSQFLGRRSSVVSFFGLEDADIPATIARDTEVAQAIVDHEAALDPHPQYTTAAELAAATAALNLASGTYTPTLTGVTNVAALVTFDLNYMRVGSVVTVSGRLEVDPTAAAPTLTSVGISLPIASNIGASTHLGGTGATTQIPLQAGGIFGDSINDRAQLNFSAVDTGNFAWFITFTYRII